MHLQLMKPDETGMRFFEFRAILVDGRARGAAEVAGRAALRRGFETKGAAHRLPQRLRILHPCHRRLAGHHWSVGVMI